MTMNKELTEGDSSTIKRVVNIKGLRFKSINENFEIRPRPYQDLTKINFSIKEAAVPENDELKQPEPLRFKESLLRQHSELDIGENYEIRKTNPLFQGEQHKTNSTMSKASFYTNSKSLPAEMSTYETIEHKSITPLNRKMLQRVDKDHIYEELYQNIDDKTKTNNTYDTFFELKENDTLNEIEKNDFRLKINVNNTFSPKENEPIYIDPADYAKIDEPSFKKDITFVNLADGTISKSMSNQILNDMSINDLYKSALSEKLKDNNKNKSKGKSLASSSNGSNQTRSWIGNSESSGASTMFGSILKTDGSSTSEEYSFQSQLYKDSIGSNFVSFNERKIIDFLEETKELKKEMNKLFVTTEIKAIDLLYNLLIVPLYQKFWIGRLNSPNVGNNMHFGDEILSIDEATIDSLENLNSNVKNSKKTKFQLKLKRLPFARIISFRTEIDASIDSLVKDNLTQETFKEKFGIRLKPNTTKIEKIDENGLFFKNGLKYNPNKVCYDLGINSSNTKAKSDEKDRFTKWVITEINGDYINYHCPAEEILARLILNSTTNVVVQPYDLVKYLYNQKR